MKTSWDLDDIFAFKTPRYVRIRDKRLGLMNLAFMVGIFGYIVGYLVISQQGYKQRGDVIGVTRLQLRAPGPDIMPELDEMEYCGNGTYKADVPDSIEFAKAPCQFLDQFDAQYPRKQANAIFLSTRITYQASQRNRSEICANMSLASCAYKEFAHQDFYVADPEFYTLFIDHSMSVPSLDVSKSAIQLGGRLLGTDGKRLDPCKPYTEANRPCPSFINLGQSGAKDIVPIAALLEAGGVNSLDDVAGTTEDLVGETKRFAGLILLVQIDYDNYYTYNPENIRYTYTVTQVSNQEFKIEQLVNNQNDAHESRLIYDRHGVQIVMLQTGSIGSFSFAQLLIVLVTSLGLLAVAQSLVNTLAFNIMPMKWVYRQYQTVNSVDFSDIEGLPKSQLNRFKTEDLLNPHPRIFSDARQGGEILAGGTGPPAYTVNKHGQTESGEDLPDWSETTRAKNGPIQRERRNPVSQYGNDTDARRVELTEGSVVSGI
eukprot:gb/GECG01004497.1/.p1 GENE.gb/GECG01004497.1/~~gb/GECG01004497.1/.p1  ORF type:complete len:486 (+),score=39.44 gb/GECG01004497.1/:1-1458(+)